MRRMVRIGESGSTGEGERVGERAISIGIAGVRLIGKVVARGNGLRGNGYDGRRQVSRYGKLVFLFGGKGAVGGLNRDVIGLGLKNRIGPVNLLDGWSAGRREITYDHACRRTCAECEVHRVSIGIRRSERIGI